MSAGLRPLTPSSEAKAAVDDMRLEAIGELLQLLGSYVRSAEEAAWRRDRHTLEIHLRQARSTLLETLTTFKEIGDEESAT